MKRLQKYLAVLTLMTMVFTSCSKEDNNLIDNANSETATLSFKAILEDFNSTRAASKQSLDDLPACTDDDAAYVRIILSRDGNNVVGSEEEPFRIDLVANQNYTEEAPELELSPGIYSLDYFGVYNEEGDLIWLAPNGGMFDTFFDNPMPLEIDLRAGVKKYVEVSVLCFDNRFVNEYGYLFFELDTTEVIEFCIFGNYCDESGRHYPAAFSVDVWNYSNGETGSLLHSNVTNSVELNDAGDYAGTSVCVTLPDSDGLDEYYFEITLLNSDAYGNVTEEVIRSGVINDTDVRNLFDGNANTDYYHFREGECSTGDSPDLFEEGGGNGECDPNDPNDDCYNQIQRNFERNYFSIQNGNFTGLNLPGANSELLEILQIRGNSNILAGGSNRIQILASGNTEEIIIGVQGQEGYYSMPTTAGGDNGTTEVNLDLNLLISQQALDNFTIVFIPSDGEGNYGQPQTLEVTRQEAGTGLLQISLSWDQPNDIDLHLIEPNGQRIYYGNTVSASGGELDVDSNPNCNIDGINNENIYYETTVPNGTYEVLVDLYSNCGIAENTNYTVVAYYDGQLIVPTTGVNPLQGNITPADYTGIISVMTFNIDGEETQRSRNTEALKASTTSPQKIYTFNYDKQNQVFEHFNSKIN